MSAFISAFSACILKPDVFIGDMPWVLILIPLPAEIAKFLAEVMFNPESSGLTA